MLDLSAPIQVASIVKYRWVSARVSEGTITLFFAAVDENDSQVGEKAIVLTGAAYKTFFNAVADTVYDAFKADQKVSGTVEKVP